MIYQLGRCPTLRAKRSAGGVRRIRVKRNKAATVDFRNIAATGDAQPTITLHTFCATLNGHGVQGPEIHLMTALSVPTSRRLYYLPPADIAHQVWMVAFLVLTAVRFSLSPHQGLTSQQITPP